MEPKTSYADNPVLAELYDFVPGYTNRGDRGFYLRQTANTRGRFLELGCGTGRILIPVAEQGGRITGLDSSKHMLARCKTKLESIAAPKREGVRLVQGDMVDFELDGKFDRVIIPFRAFQHLVDVSDQLSCLECINRHLEADGSLIFDIFNADFRKLCNPRATEETEDVSEYELPDGRRLRRTNRIVCPHPAEQYNDVELIYYLTDRDGTTQRIVHAFPMRYLFKYEVEHLLERCGFRIVNLFGDFDESPFKSDSPEMIVVGEKYREL